MYKLICIDMDGTLLNDEKEVSEKNIKLIKEADKKGVKIAICTGRPFSSAILYSEKLGIKTPVITANGAYIRNSEDDKVIYKSILGVENCKAILKELQEMDLCAHFHGTNFILVNDIDKISHKYLEMNETLPVEKQIKIMEIDNWDDTFIKYENEILKCVASDEDYQKISKAKDIMLKTLSDVEIVSSFRDNFEIMGGGVSKGRAAEVLASYYGIDKEEVICIGDNENDLSMIEYAGLGVAMGNAEEFVKKSAQYITDTNNEDGVAKVIEKFII